MFLLQTMKTALLLLAAAAMVAAIPLGFALLSKRATPKAKTHYHIRTISYDSGEYREL